MFILELNLAETLGVSILVLLLGRFLVRRVPFLNKFCIPQPVVGGLIFMLITWAGYMTNAFTVVLDTTLQTFFMLCFFTTVGFGASIKVLKRGGVSVAIFLCVSIVLCILQDVVGVIVAMLFKQNPLLGLATGSIPLTGGFGTAAAFGPLLEEMGLVSGTSISVAAATFGLVSGGLIGGPLARRLIVRHGLRADTGAAGQGLFHTTQETVLDEGHLCNAFFQIGLAVGVGSVVSALIALCGVTVPAYIGAMLVAAVMCNIFTPKSKWPIRNAEIQALGEIFLSIFLAQAMMNLHLWELKNLAFPLFVIMIAQVLLMYLFANYCTFIFMGKDYDAAMLSAGQCGFGLGAVANGVASMNAIAEKYGPSPKAFFIIPIVGALFIDFCNSGIVVAFINFLR